MENHCIEGLHTIVGPDASVNVVKHRISIEGGMLLVLPATPLPHTWLPHATCSSTALLLVSCRLHLLHHLLRQLARCLLIRNALVRRPRRLLAAVEAKLNDLGHLGVCAVGEGAGCWRM